MVSVISSVLVNTHSLGGLVMLQSPCVIGVIVILVEPSNVLLSTIPPLIHWISARGLAVAEQLNIAGLGETTVWFIGVIVKTGATADKTMTTMILYVDVQ